MGRDHTSKQHARSGHRTAPKSDNVYLKLLVKLYAFLARMYHIVNQGLLLPVVDNQLINHP